MSESSKTTFWLRLASASARGPRRALAFAALAVLVAAPGLLRLTLRTDGHALVPLNDPAVVYDGQVRARYGLRDPILVTVERPGRTGAYDLDVLRTVDRLTRDFAALPLVVPQNLDSLTTEKRDRVYPGTLDFRPFLDPLPEKPEDLAIYREDLAAMPLLRGTLLSHDEKAVAILVGAPNPLDDQGEPTADRITLYHDLAARTAAARAVAPPDTRIEIVGAPVAEALLGHHILEDLRYLVPASLAVLALMIGLAARSRWGAVIGMIKIGAAVVWTFGVMGWLGVPIYLTTAVLPVILTPIGLSDEIHLLWRYRERLVDGDPHALLTTLRELVGPIVLTSLTTAVGLLSFVFSPLVAVRSFGVFGTLGVLFCLAWGLTATPALLALLGPERLRQGATASRGSASGPLRRWLAAALAKPRRTLALLGLVTIGAAVGVSRLEIQDSWVDGFAPGSTFRVATEHIDQRFNGTHQLLAVFEFDPPEAAEGDPEEPFPAEPVTALREPRVLAAFGRFEAEVGALPGVGAALGPAAHLSTVSFLRYARRPERRALPTTSYEAERLIGWYEQVRGIERRRQLLSDDGLGAVVTLFLKDADYQQVAKIVAAVETAAHRHLTGPEAGLPSPARLGFAGDIAVSQAMIPALVRSQILSLVLALLGALLLVATVERSGRRALLLAAPVLAAVVWTLGVMGWAGIPLGVATSMFCSITLGIGIDYGIHLLAVHRRRLAEGSPAGFETALASALESGPAILVDMLAVAAGFGLLAFSQVPANARLGLVVALALGASAVLTLAGLGALLTMQRPAEAREQA